MPGEISGNTSECGLMRVMWHDPLRHLITGPESYLPQLDLHSSAALEHEVHLAVCVVRLEAGHDGVELLRDSEHGQTLVMHSQQTGTHSPVLMWSTTRTCCCESYQHVMPHT